MTEPGTLPEDWDTLRAAALEGSRIEVREVLAAAYVGRRRALDKTLLHAIVVRGDRDVAVLCRGVRLENLADAGSVENVNAEPTCERCRRVIGLATRTPPPLATKDPEP